MFPLFLYCTNGHCSSKSFLQLMLVSVFTSCNSGNKKAYLDKWCFSAFYSKKTALVKSRIWFDFIYYTEFFLKSKNVIFLFLRLEGEVALKYRCVCRHQVQFFRFRPEIHFSGKFGQKQIKKIKTVSLSWNLGYIG